VIAGHNAGNRLADNIGFEEYFPQMLVFVVIKHGGKILCSTIAGLEMMRL